MRSYMKKKHIEEELDLFQEESDFINFQKSFNKRKTITFAALFAVCVIFSVVLFTNEGLNKVTLGEEGKIELTSMPIASTVVKKGVISIPSGMVKSNPFLPYRNLGEYTSIDDLPNLELIEPPESINPSSDAARVMDTIVSGILYEKLYSCLLYLQTFLKPVSHQNHEGSMLQYYYLLLA